MNLFKSVIFDILLCIFFVVSKSSISFETWYINLHINISLSPEVSFNNMISLYKYTHSIRLIQLKTNDMTINVINILVLINLNLHNLSTP